MAFGADQFIPLRPVGVLGVEAHLGFVEHAQRVRHTQRSAHMAKPARLELLQHANADLQRKALQFLLFYRVHRRTFLL
ncbi:hypothetical protein SDC9_66682 [bioreactor metagenome]|uniref:Uncharacterized protein n=1 Tax=bioreactor metagenome TaxID=1076179 RepID=A0A644Y140_9ZZZZ